MSGLTEFEALTTLIGGPDLFQRISQDDNARAFDRLPRNRKGYPSDDANEAEFRVQAEKLGFVFGEVLDELFVAVTPPEGWSLQRTDHYMYSKLLDQYGRERGTQMYKAAAYDRDASVYFCTRFTVEKDEPANWWELLNPKQPEPVYETKRRLVEVEDDQDLVYMNYDGDFVRGRPPWPDGWERPKRMERKAVQVLAKEQPAPIPSQGYDYRMSIKDRHTGLYVYQGAVLHEPSRDTPGWHKRDAEDAERALACAWGDENLPQWRDPTAYWEVKA